MKEMWWEAAVPPEDNMSPSWKIYNFQFQIRGEHHPFPCPDFMEKETVMPIQPIQIPGKMEKDLGVCKIQRLLGHGV